MKCFSLNEIWENINRDSSLDEIKEYLLYDLKGHFSLDEKKFQNHTEYQKFTKKTIADLRYDSSTTDTVHIENFFRYKICNEFGLNIYCQNKLDIDKTKEVKKILKEALYYNMRKKGYYVSSKDINYDEKRQFTINCDNKTVFLETDTMNSFNIIFDNYLEIILEKNFGKKVNLPTLLYEEYIKVYKDNNEVCPKLKKFRLTYYLDFIKGEQTICNQYYQDILNHLGAEYIEASKLFNEFAKLTHTIGNFILVPKKFNSKRGMYPIKDYWDETISYLNDLVNWKRKAECYEENEESYKWYVENYELFNMDMFFNDINNKEAKDLTKSLENKKFTDVKEFNKYLKTINVLIRLRGISVLEALVRELKHNENLKVLKKEYQEELRKIEENDI